MDAWIWAGAGVVVVPSVIGIVVAIRRPRVKHRVARDPWALRYSLPILFVGAFAAAVAFLWAYRSIDGNDKDRADVGLKAATATAAVAAGILTWGRLELSRGEHRLAMDQDLTERYGRAVEQLGNGSSVIRAGGAFALERLALDAYAQGGRGKDTDWRMALDLLTGFIRQERPVQPHSEAPIVPVPLTVDVAAALRAVGRFNIRAKYDGASGYDLQRIDLVGADLVGYELVSVDLTAANLRGADFFGANLLMVNLTGTDLVDTILTDAHLTRAILTNANLTGANLTGANLTNASLNDANLTNANLTDADLTDAWLVRAKFNDANLTDAWLVNAALAGADLANANLTDANLTNAHVTHANAQRANLTRADLTRANLAGADLTDANLAGADLTCADLTDANLTNANLNYANLTGANLTRANVPDAKLPAAYLKGAG